MVTKDEIQELLHSTETYWLERTTSTGDMDKFQEAICTFSNDLPNSRKKGYLILRAFEVKVRPTISLNLVTDQEKVTKSETKTSDTVNVILAFCTTPRSMTEIMEHIGLKHRYNVKHRYIDPLIDGGFIEMTIPDKPNSRIQKYKRTLT